MENLYFENTSQVEATVHTSLVLEQLNGSVRFGCTRIIYCTETTSENDGRKAGQDAAPSFTKGDTALAFIPEGKGLLHNG